MGAWRCVSGRVTDRTSLRANQCKIARITRTPPAARGSTSAGARSRRLGVGYLELAKFGTFNMFILLSKSPEEAPSRRYSCWRPNAAGGFRASRSYERRTLNINFPESRPTPAHPLPPASTLPPIYNANREVRALVSERGRGSPGSSKFRKSGFEMRFSLYKLPCAFEVTAARKRARWFPRAASGFRAS